MLFIANIETLKHNSKCYGIYSIPLKLQQNTTTARKLGDHISEHLSNILKNYSPIEKVLIDKYDPAWEEAKIIAPNVLINSLFFYKALEVVRSHVFNGSSITIPQI